MMTDPIKLFIAQGVDVIGSEVTESAAGRENPRRFVAEESGSVFSFHRYVNFILN